MTATGRIALTFVPFRNCVSCRPSEDDVFHLEKKSLVIRSLRAGFGARSQWRWQLQRQSEGSLKTDSGTARERRGAIPIDWVQGVAYLDPDRPPNDVPRSDGNSLPTAIFNTPRYAADRSASVMKSRRSLPKNISSPTNIVGEPKTPRSAAAAVLGVEGGPPEA